MINLVVHARAHARPHARTHTHTHTQEGVHVNKIDVILGDEPQHRRGLHRAHSKKRPVATASTCDNVRQPVSVCTATSGGASCLSVLRYDWIAVRAEAWGGGGGGGGEAYAFQVSSACDCPEILCLVQCLD